MENKNDAVESAMSIGKSISFFLFFLTKPEDSQCHPKLELLGLFCQIDVFPHPELKVIKQKY